MKYITTLLADDDYLVLQDLKALVDWKALGFQIAGTASNGRRALSLAQKLKPQLIITDISMPVMDGFDFIETVQEMYPDTYIMLISSYADFEYAKRAMADGIGDYILKNEITSKLMEEKLTKAAETLKSNASARQRNLRVALTEYFQEDRELPQPIQTGRYLFYLLTFHLPLEKLNPHFRHVPQYGIKLYDSISSAIRISFPNALIFNVGNYLVAGIPPQEIHSIYSGTTVTRGENQLRSIANQCRTEKLLISCYPERVSIKEFKAVFQKLRAYLNFQSSFIEGFQTDLRILYQKTFSPCRQLFPYDLIKTCLSSPEQYYQQLYNYLTVLFNQKDADSIYMLYHNTLLQLEELSGHLVNISSCRQFQGQEDLFDFFKQSYELCREKVLAGRTFHYSLPTQKAIQYMQDSLSDSNLTIEKIASAVGLSASRLSVLFKQETENTVNDFLTDIRISHAVHLLENSSMKIYEIASAVGYKSAQYFSQVFQQKTGHKPLYFRQKKPISQEETI